MHVEPSQHTHTVLLCMLSGRKKVTSLGKVMVNATIPASLLHSRNWLCITVKLYNTLKVSTTEIVSNYIEKEKNPSSPYL